MKVYTSNYKNCKSENGISISGDRGKRANFNGPCLSIFAPKKGFYNTWKNNIGKISEEENTLYYITEYYKQVLSKLDPEETLKLIPEDSILLCYEDNMEFCHRHLVAFWFELFLGVKTSEIYENPLRETKRTLERPTYLKEMLEKVIKDNYDMKGFMDIRDVYNYERSLKNIKPLKKKLVLKDNCLLTK